MPIRGPDPINVHVGNRLRMVRRARRLVQKELAEVVNVSFQQLQKYERGMNRIGPGALYRLACFLGVPIEFFYQDLSEGSWITGHRRLLLWPYSSGRVGSSSLSAPLIVTSYLGSVACSLVSSTGGGSSDTPS